MCTWMFLTGNNLILCKGLHIGARKHDQDRHASKLLIAPCTHVIEKISKITYSHNGNGFPRIMFYSDRQLSCIYDMLSVRSVIS